MRIESAIAIERLRKRMRSRTGQQVSEEECECEWESDEQCGVGEVENEASFASQLKKFEL